MASSTACTPIAAQPGSAETATRTPLSAAAPAPMAMNAAAGTAVLDQPEAEQRLGLLMGELEQLAPIVHPAHLRRAADRLDALASIQARTWRALLLDNASPALPDNSPGPVEHLSFTNMPLTDEEARSVNGFIGSIDGGDERDVLASPLPEDGVGPLTIDERLWPGGPSSDSMQIAFVYDDARANAGARCAPCDGDGDRDRDSYGDGATDDGEVGNDGGDGPRDPRLGSWCRRDSVGLAQHGRRMFCDYHDLHSGCADACMARDMMQQRRISTLVEKQQKRRRKRPRDDPDGRDARHACYKAVIAWQWANPLGAENRVRLPNCVTVAVRQLFPNPICLREGSCCDFLLKCEKEGHYTGFPTAEESRAIREGFFQGNDLT